MKITIVFHSVSANTYLMAKYFYEELSIQNPDVSLYRVADEDFETWCSLSPVSQEFAEEIRSIPIAVPEILLKSDHVFLGSPTYFGNVSSEMKSFMDSTASFWPESKLFGKKLTAFSSCGTPEGGGELCLQSINTFGQHMGMIPVPVPSNLLDGVSFPAYGLLHYSGNQGDIRPNETLRNAIAKYIFRCIRSY